MKEPRERTPFNKTTVTVLVALIVLFIIGIVIRWDYIRKEVTDSFRNRFSTGQSISDTVR